ncbi:unnamed protein product [Adineta ricciae]|uniref:Serine aminopeptidase S33 domain-containing protein n=1 Tax=Adineta ricciae TaxID=249248 RepID=A0A815R2K9_ADIRI|nr:unnamed protein product [Adineta ricciae]CAF1471107.1 unnamed protein product [Adineta ricciae]
MTETNSKSNAPKPIEFPSFYEDHIMLSGRHWPVDKPKASLLFIHTFGDHGARTTFLQQFFSQHHFAVFDYDWRGHGRSHGERGFIPNAKASFGDTDAAIDQIKQKYPSLPLIIWGDGIGASIIIFYAMKHTDKLPFQGLIVSSPAANLPKAKVGRIQLGIVRTFSNLSPTVRLPVRAEQYAIEVTDDEEVLRNYKNDRYVHDRWPARTLDIMLEASFQIQRGFRFPIPLLIQYGTKSIIKREVIQDWVDRSSSTKIKEFKIWEGLHHELHNDSQRNDVFQYSLEWIENNILNQTE